MKLKKCYVFSFGKIQDKTFDFNSELNTFKEDNGWGKSTLATFIKSIFYGLNDSKKSVSENERLKYKTWNTTQKFGGYIEFEWGGKEFKLERYFGNKQSEDTVSLIDLETGKSFSNTENLGARIFQIDEEGFLSTTYFSQKDFQVKSNTSLTAKFNSICEIQDNDAFDNAVEKLEEKSKLYKKTGDKGLIADTKREIFAVNEEIQRANLAGKTAESLKLGVKSLESEVEELKVKSENLTKRVAEAGRAEAVAVKKGQYDGLVNKKEQYLTKKAQLDYILNGERPTEQELNACLDCCKELNNVTALEKVLVQDINELNARQTTEKANKIRIGVKEVLAILGSITFLVALVLSIVNKFAFSSASIVLFALTAVFEIVAFTLTIIAKPKKETAEENERLQQKINNYNEYKNIRESYEQNLSSFLAKFNVDTSDCLLAISNISSLVKSVNLIENELKEITKSLQELEKEKPLFDNSQNSQNLSMLNAELSLAQEQYSKKATELAKKRADIRYYQDQADKLSELEERKGELTLKQEQYKEEYDILLKTLEFLSKADENLKIKYREPLQSSLNKYLSLISENKKSALIDIDLNVTIEEKGGIKQTDYYSKGEQNLFEICKRFALTDVLFTGEKPFIILDDPFYNLDDAKLKQALELIKKLSKEYQILYFVCHESRRV